MTASGAVLYATFATARVSGGVQVMSDHVRLLRAAGRDASLWLPSGPVPDWFDPRVPVVTADDLPVGADDLLVLPEVPVVPGRPPAPGVRTVLLNQNHFYTYAVPGWGEEYPGWEPPPQVWVVSHEAADVLRALHPGVRVRRVPPPVDGEQFRPAPGGPRGPVVAWMPRKRPRESALLDRLLRTDPRLADADLHPLVDRSRADVARTLSRTAVFVALGHSEGLGLPVAEAMAAGCLVVGYDGGGGRELFDAPGVFAVPAQRPLVLRDRVVDLLGRRDELAPLAAANRTWVLERHADDVVARELLAAVDAASAGPGRAGWAVHPAEGLDALGPAFTAWA